MTKVTIALGANLGNPLTTLRKVVDELRSSKVFHDVRVSAYYDTSPVQSSGPDYVNAVLTAQTALGPYEVLRFLQSLENRYGRVRPAGIVNAPRTLDLDVLQYGDLHSDDPVLTLPHPRMKERLFVLCPLADIEGEDFLLDDEPLSVWIQRVRHKDPSQTIAFLSKS